MSYPTKFGEGTESPAELALALAMDAAGLTYEKQKEFSEGTWRRERLCTCGAPPRVHGAARCEDCEREHRNEAKRRAA